jgi:hypothetical protein
MRTNLFLVWASILAAGCGSSSGSQPGLDGSPGNGGNPGTDSAMIVGTGGNSPHNTGGVVATGGQATTKDAAGPEIPSADTRPVDTRPPATDGAPTAGNPNGACLAGVPARGQLVNTTTPTTVVGTGTEASCAFSQLKTAVAAGGIITFNCGPNPVTIPVTSTLVAPITKDTVIDGGGKIILDGGGAVQILRFESPNFNVVTFGLTLQRITLTRGKATPTKAIPTAPAPCSQGWDDGQGGAVFVRDGSLTVIDAIFSYNTAAPVGPDVGGGAIYILGSKNGLFIAGSTFTENSASNAGAVGGLFAEFNIYNSLFTNNTATGNGANGDEQSKCSVKRDNGQYQTGSGGNGGALCNDGQSRNILLCGNAILNNKAGQGAFGGGLFFTSNDFGGTLTITDTTMTGNTGGSWTSVATGTVKNAGTAVGTNTKSLTITNSTLQGVP